MYDTVISKFNTHLDLDLYYTDTDSLTMKESTWDFLINKYQIKNYKYDFNNHTRIKQFGDYECEIRSNEINIFAPKSYFYFADLSQKSRDKLKIKDDETFYKLKAGFKGIKLSVDSFITEDQLAEVKQMNQK